ncbi:MAG: hypothetical protein K2W96_18280, partial [Gemmataceae bacterium]|nr:hypothetical protein [Gemmataceae bacterium]
AVMAAALLGGLWRLVLLLPADVYARMWGGPEGGSLRSWLAEPGPDDGFLRLFVLATWWAGAVAGAFLAWKKGGGPLDLLFGVVAGAVAGLAAAATVGCVLVVGDTVPRMLLSSMASGGEMGSGTATALWMFLAVLSWIGLGAAAGAALALAGGFGHGLLGTIGAPFAGASRLAGMKGLASLFEPKG